MERASKAAGWSVEGSSRPAVASREEAVTVASREEVVTSSSPAPTATRPYYECVFCKRGFTTAQALGGHMNIHRRDRDRIKPAPPSRRLDAPVTKCYGNSASYPPPQLATSPMRSGSFSMLYHTGGAGAAVAVDADKAVSPRELSLFCSNDDHDRDLQLGLGFHGTGWRAPEGPSSERRQDGEAERNLDLELRLGPRPRH